MARVLVLVAHPDLRLSRVNRALLEAARGFASGATGAVPAHDAGLAVEVRDLYALYPDYVIDVPAEQAAAARADLIVWQHPIHWYAMPPLMKLWLDDVLALGWAYGHGPGGVGTALRGKHLWLVASTGGAEAAYRPDGYNHYFFDAFVPPYAQTAALCGLRFLPPLLLHGAHAANSAELKAHVATYVGRLGSYPNWPEMAELDPCPSCDMPPGERPAADSAQTEVRLS